MTRHLLASGGEHMQFDTDQVGDQPTGDRANRQTQPTHPLTLPGTVPAACLSPGSVPGWVRGPVR